MAIAVGTVIADRPPHRSVRAALPHTARTLDGDDHPARRGRAEARTPNSPRDLETRRCVRSSSHCSTCSLVSPLPSTDSADSGPLSVFAGFCGTMELSDSPATCRSDLWPRAFSDRSAPIGRSGCRRGLSTSVRNVSNRACGLRLRGGHSGLAVVVRHDYCFPLVRTRSATAEGCVRSSIHSPVVPL